ncbi:MAG: hypothetical protein U0R68_17920 [Candidatus Nanopelagicales bacterium]
MMRKVYGALLVALGLLVLLKLANGNGMLQLAGVLLVLAGLAVAILRHPDDDAATTAAAPTETATAADLAPDPTPQPPDA